MKLVWIAVVLAVVIINAYCEEELDSNSMKKYTSTGDVDDRDRLFKRLSDTYDKRNYPTNTTVKFGLSVLDLEINEHRSTLEAAVWMKVVWEDKRLAWDKTDFDLDILRVPSDEVWKPDLTLYNSANPSEMVKCWPSNIIVYNTGKVLWVPPCHISAYCNLTLSQTPYGEQYCSLKFGSWTFDSYSADLQFYDDKKVADLSDYWGVSDWELTSNTAERIERYYPCCAEPYTSITYNFTIQRKSSVGLDCPKR